MRLSTLRTAVALAAVSWTAASVGAEDATGLAKVPAGLAKVPAGLAKVPAGLAKVPASGSLRGAVDTAIKRVYPALVRIHVVAYSFHDGREVKGEGSGSGVIISSEGHVVTNHHVAGRARRIQCTLADKQEVEATLVGTDALADVAVLKLDLTGRKSRSPLPVAHFGDSDSLRVGDEVLAMGSPRAISQSVTLGIVSNTEMTFPSLFWPATFKLDGEETGSLVKWIGHDAQIFPGNSGGPLVNLAGDIVGINEISFGLAGAIPGNIAREVADQLIKTGEVKRSWLGLELQPLLKGGSEDRGALVSGVVAGSPAESAGLLAGDLLLAFDGHPVSARYAEQLPEFNRLLLGTRIGTRVELSISRDGVPRTVPMTTVARGSAQGVEAEARAWGLTFRELTLLAAKELKREPLSGVLVSSVRPGSGAAEAKPALQPRDILLEVAGTPVRTVKELLALTDSITAGKDKPVPVLVAFERRTEKLLTVVRLGDREERDRSAEATKAWLPASSQVLTPDLAEALGLKGRKGIRLTEIYPASTAEAAGLKIGDVVLQIDGDPVNASQPEEVEVFPAMVRQYRIGARVKLSLVREGQPREVEVELAPSPRSTRELVEYRDPQFEFSSRDLTLQDRVQGSLSTAQTGALITRVESGGWAALARMAVGDIVLSVDGRPVSNSSALETFMREVASGKPSHVVFLVRRGVHTLFLELEPAWT